MEAALAANVLNLDKLAGAAQRPVVVVPSDLYTQYAAADLSIPLPPQSSEGQGAEEGVAVPDVSGLPARSAIRELHKHGLRVADVGPGAVIRTFPTAGSLVTRGHVVRLRYRGQDDE